MKKSTITLLITLIMMLSLNVHAENQQELKPQDKEIWKNNNQEKDSWMDYNLDTVKFVNLYNSAVGLAYSNMSGYGLTFSKRFLNDYAISITGIIFYDENMSWKDMTKTEITRNDKAILYDLGFEIQRDILVTNKTKIYALMGASYSSEENQSQYNKYVKDEYSVGLGFGFQWFWSKHIAADFHFGYKFHNSDVEDYNKPSTERKTDLGFGLGIMYLF